MPRRTRDQVQKLLQAGKSCSEIASELDIARSTVTYHKRMLGFVVQRAFGKRFDWAAIRAHYDAGYSIRECRAKFGFSTTAWANAVVRGDVVPRPHAMSIDRLLAVPRNRTHLKGRLLAVGLLDPRCEECGIDEWRDRPLALELHHRNGNGADNRLENLSLLCPNCHSQTASWGGRNRSRAA